MPPVDLSWCPHVVCLQKDEACLSVLLIRSGSDAMTDDDENAEDDHPPFNDDVASIVA
jgi:hypothetical protein